MYVNLQQPEIYATPRHTPLDVVSIELSFLFWPGRVDIFDLSRALVDGSNGRVGRVKP